MPIYHLFLVLLVIFAWGFNFIFVKLGLTEISPLLLCALRFLIACFPAILFIKPPAAPFRLVIYYGLLMFGLQFSLLFIGMKVGMTPGLTSILMQMQVFFSILIAVFFLGELPTFWQIMGALVSFSGIGLVALHLDHQSANLPGFLLIMAAGIAWGIGNVVTKKMGRINIMALVVWGSLVAFFPLLIASLIFEGKANLIHTLHHITWVGAGSVLYIVYISTWVGYGLWNYLISRHNVAIVAPFTLLVPVVAMLSSALICHESLPAWKLLAALLVMSGLSLNFLAPRLLTKRKSVKKEPQLDLASTTQTIQ